MRFKMARSFFCFHPKVESISTPLRWAGLMIHLDQHNVAEVILRDFQTQASEVLQFLFSLS